MDALELSPLNGNQEIKLKQVIGLFDGVLIILGAIIGSGIFLTPAGVLSQLQSVSCSLFVWFLCGLVSILGAFCFAELAYLVPKAGSGYAYLYEGFAKKFRFGNLPAFFSAWLSTCAITPGSVAVISLTSAEYLYKAIFGTCFVSRKIVTLIAILIIVSSAVINCVSVKWSTRINNAFSLGKIGALILITCFGVYNLAVGKVENLRPDFHLATTTPFKWANAFYYGLFSYDGWFALNCVVEELKNPKKNLPLAILISLVLIIILYIMVNISYLTVLTAEEMLSNPAVALAWGERTLGSYAFIILVAVFISNYGAVLTNMLATTRITFSAARDNMLPVFFSMINIDYITPSPSVILTAIISILMTLSSDIYGLLDFFTFIIWIFYGLNMVALIILRREEKARSETAPSVHPKEFRLKLPLVFPVIMLLFCIGLIAMSLSSPNFGHLIAVAITLLGLIYYIPFVYLKKSCFLIDKFNRFLQCLFNVSTEQKKMS